MRPVVDAGNQDADGKVDGGYGDKAGEVAPSHIAHGTAVHDEVSGEGAEDAEDCAACANGDGGPVEEIAECATGQPCQQINGGEAEVSVNAFDEPTEYEESEAVEE